MTLAELGYEKAKGDSLSNRYETKRKHIYCKGKSLYCTDNINVDRAEQTVSKYRLCRNLNGEVICNRCSLGLSKNELKAVLNIMETERALTAQEVYDALEQKVMRDNQQ